MCNTLSRNRLSVFNKAPGYDVYSAVYSADKCETPDCYLRIARRHHVTDVSCGLRRLSFHSRSSSTDCFKIAILLFAAPSWTSSIRVSFWSEIPLSKIRLSAIKTPSLSSRTRAELDEQSRSWNTRRTDPDIRLREVSHSQRSSRSKMIQVGSQWSPLAG